MAYNDDKRLINELIQVITRHHDEAGSVQYGRKVLTTFRLKVDKKKLNETGLTVLGYEARWSFGPNKKNGVVSIKQKPWSKQKN